MEIKNGWLSVATGSYIEVDPDVAYNGGASVCYIILMDITEGTCWECVVWCDSALQTAAAGVIKLKWSIAQLMK